MIFHRATTSAWAQMLTTKEVSEAVPTEPHTLPGPESTSTNLQSTGQAKSPWGYVFPDTVSSLNSYKHVA